MTYRDTNHNPRLVRAEDEYDRSLEECSHEFRNVHGVHNMTSRHMKSRQRRSKHGDRKLKAAQAAATTK